MVANLEDVALHMFLVYANTADISRKSIFQSICDRFSVMAALCSTFGYFISPKIY